MTHAVIHHLQEVLVSARPRALRLLHSHAIKGVVHSLQQRRTTNWSAWFDGGRAIQGVVYSLQQRDLAHGSYAGSAAACPPRPSATPYLYSTAIPLMAFLMIWKLWGAAGASVDTDSQAQATQGALLMANRCTIFSQL